MSQTKAEDIRTKMDFDDRCPDCGALLNGQPACGHCGCEPEPPAGLATIIALPLPAAPHASLAWTDEPQVA